MTVRLRVFVTGYAHVSPREREELLEVRGAGSEKEPKAAVSMGRPDSYLSKAATGWRPRYRSAREGWVATAAALADS